MLTLYGDYVRYRGGEIGIGSLIQLLKNFGLSEQSVRSAVYRMCRGGLLKVRHNGTKSYYSLTESGLALLEEGRQRIFDKKKTKWDGSWSVVVYFIPEEKREARDTLRQELTWMGYGPLSTATWISPNDLSKEVEELAGRLKIREYLQVFRATHLGFSSPKEIISRCWDLKRIHRGYAGFINEYQGKLEGYREQLRRGENIEPGECFAERFKLIHEYRRLPFFDPDLPEELLPDNWLRSRARGLFREYYDLLGEKANSYFDSVLKAY
jgi:phenylacetic acid degradation operon negative regulatory protein